MKRYEIDFDSSGTVELMEDSDGDYCMYEEAQAEIDAALAGESEMLEKVSAEKTRYVLLKGVNRYLTAENAKLRERVKINSAAHSELLERYDKRNAEYASQTFENAKLRERWKKLQERWEALRREWLRDCLAQNATDVLGKMRELEADDE